MFYTGRNLDILKVKFWIGIDNRGGSMLNYNDLKLLFKEQEEQEEKTDNLKQKRLELEEKRHLLKMREFERKEKADRETYERKLEKMRRVEIEEHRKAKREALLTGVSILSYIAIIVFYVYFVSKLF